jgi:CHASE3 domain sensor protein
LRLLPWHFRLLIGAVVAASLITLALSEFTVRSALNDVDRSNRVLRQLAKANQLKALVVDMETGQRGYLLTGDVSYLAPYRTAVNEFEVVSRSLRELLPVGSELGERLNRIDSLAIERLEVATTVITLTTSGQRDAAVELVGSGRGKQLMNELSAELAAIETQSQAKLQVLQVRQRRAAVWSRLALLASTVIAIVLLLLVVRQAINQATAELHLHDEATRNAFRMEDIIASRTAELIDLWSHLQSVTERRRRIWRAIFTMSWAAS